MDIAFAQFIATLLSPLLMAFSLWLVLRQQNTNKPLTSAQIATTKAEGLSNEFDVMEKMSNRQALFAEKQTTVIETLRGDVLRAINSGEERIAAFRIETEARLVKHDLASQTEIKRLNDQLLAQGITAREQSDKQEGLLTQAMAKIDSLNKEIIDLKAMLTKANKETAEAKADTAEAEKKAAA
jgi:hypothetical protein